MKKIGILGGMAPESTMVFYRRLIQLSQENLPRGKYPVVIIYSLDMSEFRKPLKAGDYQRAAAMISEGIDSLSKAGAEFAVIASVTPHMFFARILEKSPIPLINMVEETAKKAKENGFEKVGLYGTKFTMESGFYNKEFEKYGILVAIPGDEERDYIHEKAMGELANGKVVESTREKLVQISQKMVQKDDIQALVLGSTEFSLLLNEEVVKIPVLDTAGINIHKIFNFSQE